ncbi:MAG: carboxypeptidase-like regulatory domain-containing protein, partial [Candidatus Omnitrophota bacterium]
MKKKITLFLAGGLLFFVAQAQAVQSLPYLQDFSSDPGWATNNAANFSRDGSSGTYSAKSITYSNEYSVIETNYSAGSIRIEYDIKVTNRDSNGETIFGLFGPAYTSFQTSPYDQPCLYVSLGGSENKFQLVGITNSGNQYAVSSALNAVELNKWYRVYLFYDALRQKIAVRIKDKANLDSWVWGAELDIAGTFPANMNYLGFSMVGEWPGSPAMQEAYIDNLKLTLTGAISGRVTAENGNPINNVYIDTSVWGNQWQHYETAWNRTQADGTYYIPCLEPADYRLQATSAPGYGHLYYNNTEDFGQATPVNVQTGEETRDINFTLPFAGELSGSVYEPDGTTPVPYQNISIRKADGLHYDFGARTDEFGFYRFYVAYGNYKINTNNWENDTNFQAEYYNNRSTFEAADVVSVSPGYDATDINFTLDYGASLTGVVLDERLNRLPQIMTTAHNQNSTRTFSNILGKFFLRGRPEEQTEVLAQPEPSLGYVWSGSDPGDDLDINLNENSKNHPLICLDGALATGYIKDASGKPVTGGEFWAGSKNLDAWDRIDSNGRYQIRLPLGRQRINFENEDLGYSALPIEVTVTDTATEITLPDAIAYDALSGASLSGQVINSAGFSKQGAYGVAVFEAGKIIDAEAVYGLGPVAYTELNTAGPYTFPALPPGSNYLVSLLVTNWDSFPEYVSVRDFRDYVNVPITDIDLTYPSEGGTIIGKVTDSGNKPVVGAYLVFNRQSDNQFLGFGITNKDGDFKLYNFPPAACNVTATHFRYANTTATATITEGQETNLGILILSSADEQAIRNGYAQVQAYFAAENIDALMETYADTYLHQGETKASLRPHLGDLFNYCHDISLNFELKYIQLVGERAIVKVDFGYSAIRDSDNKPTRQGWKDELQYFRKESGIWKLSGDEELFAIDNSVQVNYGE